MKKPIIILAFLLVVVFRGFAQDTIIGVVSRIAAPYFEQNVCDSRFAITAEDETYYVMVDGYWPNPYLEDLVIHYDTIPVGNEIEVVGEIKEMEDGNGSNFNTIVVSKNLTSNHREILGFFGYGSIVYPNSDTVSAARFYHYNGMDVYYITINGELQTQRPFVINGRTLVLSKRYLFIGQSDTITDYYGNTFNAFELADALPYDQEDVSICGILTKENDLCLSSPSGETHFLSLFDGEEYHYLTNKRKLQYNFINDAVFMEGDSVIGDILVVQTNDDESYYLKPFIYEHIAPDHILVGDHTIYVGDSFIATGMISNWYYNQYYLEKVIEITSVGFEGVQEIYPADIQIFTNSSIGIIEIHSEQPIKSVSAYDQLGRVLFIDFNDSNKISLDLHGYKGVVLICVIFENGHKTIKKEIIR